MEKALDVSSCAALAVGPKQGIPAAASSASKSPGQNRASSVSSPRSSSCGTAIPAFPQTPLDTNGAGDTHTGVLLAERALGADWESAATRANAAAAIAVTRRGPQSAPARAEAILAPGGRSVARALAAEVVADLVREVLDCPVVLDPVMVATSGDRLLAPEAEQAMCEYCATADVVTPNIPELAVLVGTEPATDVTEAIAQATDWARRTQTAVIVKTGHLDGASAANIWVAADGHTITVPSTRIDTTNTHGTGCTLASAIAARLAQGQSLSEAVEGAGRYLHEAIVRAPGLGSGHGPVDHVWPLRDAVR